VVGSVLVRSQSTTETAAYLDPHQPVDRRVEDLLGRMTLKEKVGQLNLPCVYVSDLGNDIQAKMEACRRFAAGTYTGEIGPGSGFFTLADNILQEGTLQQANYFNELQKIALTQTRLKIPLLEDEEGTHGAMLQGPLFFRRGWRLAVRFDPDLTKSVYSAAAQEARAVGIHLLSTLVMELDRDPRMGRNAEVYTEDPTSTRSWQRALSRCARLRRECPGQGRGRPYRLPHAERTCERLRERRHRIVGTDAPRRLPGSLACGHYQVRSYGSYGGYPEIDDEPAHASRKWLTQVLRQELGFDGLVEK